MHDPRLDRLADVLIGHSTRLQEGEKILIEAIDVPAEVVLAIVRRVRAAKGLPVVSLRQNVIERELAQGATEAGTRLIGDIEKYRMEKMDAYIAVRGSLNISEMSDVSPDRIKLVETHITKPVHFEVRVPKTRWVVLRYPSPSFAQQANMSTIGFEDFYFDVCTMDYDRMSKAVKPLVERMTATDEVHITGVDTDLLFSIKDIPVVPCAGERNIPDGECFTAPVRASVNGHIHFNAPTIYHGVTFKDVRLAFQGGKVVEATADKSERLNEILDSDEGARYVGEFSLGFNPYIDHPILDILFDEKIAGSFHFTPGAAYEEADNGNRSQVHWDLVMIQTAEYGGGEVRFDGELVRKDGRFVPPELQGLNPEKLRS